MKKQKRETIQQSWLNFLLSISTGVLKASFSYLKLKGIELFAKECNYIQKLSTNIFIWRLN